VSSFFDANQRITSQQSVLWANGLDLPRVFQTSRPLPLIALAHIADVVAYKTANAEFEAAPEGATNSLLAVSGGGHGPAILSIC
jgi:hypothetical protein